MSSVCNAENLELLACRMVSVVVVIAILHPVKIVGKCPLHVDRVAGGQRVDATMDLHLL
jgi:hypothetical protein